MIPSEILKAQNAYGVIQAEMSPEIMVIEFPHRYDRNNQQKMDGEDLWLWSVNNEWRPQLTVMLLETILVTYIPNYVY